jgi:DNA polymerase-1
MPKLALIDGDEVAFKASSISQSSIDWDGDGAATPIVSRQQAFGAAASMVRSWTEGARCERPAIVLSPKDRANYRKRLLASYKAHRGDEKPQVYWDVVDFLRTEYEVYQWPGVEGDDCMGVLATNPRLDCVIVSQDKDMQTLPVRWYNPTRQILKTINQTQADWFWMKQTIMGDPTDGYKGIPKVGEKGADKILANGFGNFELMWRAVVEAYEKAGLTEADAITQARMARILRYGDMDLEKNVIYLWHPRTRVPIPLEVKYSDTGTSEANTHDDRSDAAEAAAAAAGPSGAPDAGREPDLPAKRGRRKKGAPGN